MLEERLKQIGLTETEAKLYLIIFEKIRISPGELSKLSNIKRSTVYSAVLELINKRLIEEQVYNKKKIYISLSSEQLNLYIKKKEDVLQKEKEITQNIISNMKSIQRINSNFIPQVNIVSGDENIVKFLKERGGVLFNELKNTTDNTVWGFQEKDILKNEKIFLWNKEVWDTKKNIFIQKILTNYNEFEEKNSILNKYKNRKVLFFDGFTFSSTQWILGDIIINISVDKGIYYLVEIKEKKLAENLRNFFKYIYNQELEKKSKKKN